MSNNDNEEDSFTRNLPPYRITQKGIGANISVDDLDSLVTHHPGANSEAVAINGIPSKTEDPKKRSYGMIGGEIQEIETLRTDGTRSLKTHQILLIKDFILEDSRIPPFGKGARAVDIPSPISGYIGDVSEREGRVDILDRKGGEIIARILHMRPISVRVGDTVEYGQALGIQNNIGLGYSPGVGIHVHAEIDTRYYQHFENYISDLKDGRLALDEARRAYGIPPLPISDDGTFRLGEQNALIHEFQEVLLSEGYLGVNEEHLRAGGTYSLNMQPAVLAYQRDHGLAQTGDIDRSTLHVALPHRRGQPIDRLDHVDREHAPFAPSPKADEPIRMYRPGPDDHQRHPESLRNDPRNPEHRDHAFFELLQRTLPPGTSDEMVAHVLLEAKIGKVRGVGDVEKIMVHNDRVFVMGKTPGFRAAVDLAQAPPPMQDTVQRSDALDAERMQRQQWLAQEQQLSRNPSMSRSL